MIRIEGDKVVLRTPALADLDYIRWLWADAATMKDVGGPIAVDERQAWGWFARMVDPGAATDRYFLICGRDDVPVGEVSFHRYDPKSKTGELNIKIAASRRYQGHGPEAMRLFLGYFFNVFGGELMVDGPLNLERKYARKALRSVGFEHDRSRSDGYFLQMTKQRFVAFVNGQ